MAYIELEHVSKTLAGKAVLHDISLRIERGETVGFVGANGSGKTMLFRAIAGLMHTDGRIIVDGKALGEEISFPPDMGIMIENVGLWPELTGKKSLQILAKARNRIGEREICEAITRVGLDPQDKRPFRKYSLGMKQRMVLAQAMMEQPELLILDEPTNALDGDGVMLFRDRIREEKARNTTILLASHNQEDIRELCDRVLFMSGGRIVQEGGV